jgi:hypothetical protein
MVEKPTKPGKFQIEFVDPLFAVAIHLGFSHRLFGEHWFEVWQWPEGQEIFRFWTFGLCFLTVLLAWLGYHESIRVHPVRALGRFLVDVVLVSLYAVLLVKSDDLHTALTLLTIIYALYVLWSLLKTKEYPEEYPRDILWKSRYRREIVTFGWFIAFVALWLASGTGLIAEWALLTLAYLFTVGHRVNKAVPIWGTLGNALSRLFVRGD